MLKDFRDVLTGRYFIYRGKLYMKCANSYEPMADGYYYDTEYNTWLSELWPTKAGQRFFKNSTKVHVCKNQDYRGAKRELRHVTQKQVKRITCPFK